MNLKWDIKEPENRNNLKRLKFCDFRKQNY